MVMPPAGKIVDSNNAVNVMQIPVMNGRDAFDLVFEQRANVEMLKINDQVYISGDNLEPIHAGASTCSIGSDGYARWFKVDGAAGKKMVVAQTNAGSYIVYDSAGEAVFVSLINEAKPIQLPAGELIVFAGDPRAVFLKYP